MKFLASCLAAATALLAVPLAGAQMPAPAPAAPVTPATPVAPGIQSASPAAAVIRPLPRSQWSPLQIRQAFEFADSDANGELTRAEAQQLTIMPRGFEDIDGNKDGVMSRSEYEKIFAR